MACYVYSETIYFFMACYVYSEQIIIVLISSWLVTSTVKKYISSWLVTYTLNQYISVFPHHVCVGLLDFYCKIRSSSPLLPHPPPPPPLQSPPAIYRQLPPSTGFSGPYFYSFLYKALLLYTASCLPAPASLGPYFYSFQSGGDSSR